ncbi:CopD family protein [Kordiimonas aquimaris]|uniref:CopD family protein n=1 Tax=Kordiimonas aquimaris TaxID=707591 RepID=UPI0021D06EE5|nr:CopD family protein [Kordiimonas aquimaris]
MEGFLGEFYLWVKAFHIIFVIFWMAALFMMPRFFAYHCQYDVGSDEDKHWIERETRLKKIIMNPAMMIAWTLGILLVLNIGMGAGGWLHLKLLLVVFLTGFHIYLGKQMKVLASGEHVREEKFYRKINEVPAAFIIIIVILAVVRPF